MAAISLIAALTSACDDGVLEPQLDQPLEPRFASSQSVTIDESTFSAYITGSLHVAEFSDLDGNHYSFHGNFDADGRLTSADTYFNGVHLGTDVLTWSGYQVTERLNTHAAGYWLTTDGAGNLTDYYADNPYPCPDPGPQDPGGGGNFGGSDDPGECDDSGDTKFFAGGDFMMYVDGPCSDELEEWAEETVETLVAIGIAGGATGVAIYTPPPAQVWAGRGAVAAWAGTALKARRWFDAFRSYDNCRRVQRGLQPH